MAKPDGGPAFPQLREVEEQRFNESTGRYEDYPVVEAYGGMSLRDYAMIHAPAATIQEYGMRAIADCNKFLGKGPLDGWTVRDSFELDAKLRRMWADAMIAEREKDDDR